jgi:hypothetical protein
MSVLEDIIQSLWIGPRLTAMERLTIESYLRHGYAFHLFTYGDVANVPDGTVVRDGREILPEERIFYYKKHRSVSGFSNFFRYKLLVERGGWWVDMDMVALEPFTFEGEHVFASERSGAWQHNPTCSAMKAPRGSEAMAWAFEVCESKDTKTLKWGQTGPQLLTAAVERFGLQDAVQPPDVFCPVDYEDWRLLLKPDATELPPQTRAVHLWHEKWRRAELDMDAAYDAKCMYERLKRHVGGELNG